MSKYITKENTNNECWVSEQEKIISFSSVPGYQHMEFERHEEMIDHILVTLNGEGYRVQ